MFGGGLTDEVIQHIEYWIPKRSYRRETKFQNDLKEYLDIQLNESESSGMGMGMGMGNRRQIPVKREHGSVNADVAVGDDIGIELKRNFTNSNKHRLSGQIQDYMKEFPIVIVVACGISDMDGWRELQNDYASSGGMGMGMGMGQSEVHFIHKRKEHFGKDPSEVHKRGDGFFGDSLF